MTGFVILILLVVVLPYVYRWLRPYIYRWMQRRAENYMRRAMGMPPRGKSDSNKKDRSQRREEARGRSRGEGPEYGRRAYASPDEPLIPKEYAEDVAFTEIHSYSEDTVIGEEEGHVRVKVESQVSDAEIIEIKKNR